MTTTTLSLVQQIAHKYFPEFSFNDVQDFFAIAFTVNPSLEEKLINAPQNEVLQNFFADAAKVIETQAGIYTVNNDLLKAINDQAISS